MTLKTISGFRGTEEAKAVEGEIKFRASGAAIFSIDPASPKASAPTSPAL